MPLPPQTTVVIAAWGGYVGEELVDALESVRAQDRPVRIVLMDNASEVPFPDLGDVEIVRSEQRLTLGGARNAGMQHVDTPYVVFWDADDEMLPGTLAVLENSITADRRLVAYGAAILESDSRRRHRWPRRWITNLRRVPRLLALVDCVWSVYPTTGATIMRSSEVREAGGYAPTDSGHDWVLGVSLAFRGRLGWTERPGRLYRIHPHSVLAQHSGWRDLLDKAHDVRRRLRADRAVPRSVRMALPLIQLCQYLAIISHLFIEGVRGLRRIRGPATTSGAADA